ncbi:MAG: RsmE family RNA methyltransferase [Sediminibacterium sp.]|jgi:16S rRNA (uracil1498-N3)-methyltransferase
MSVPFFFEPKLVDANLPFVLSETTSKHCVQVLRMKVGQPLNLTDGKGNLFMASLLSADKQKSVALIEKTSFTTQSNSCNSVGISLLKNADRFEWMLEKITEIGIIEIYPLICKRTEHQRFRYDRMQQILVAAMLQSEQVWLPVLHEPIDVMQLIPSAKHQQKLIAHCTDDSKNSINTLPITNNALILIGPEGDFTPDEISLAKNNAFLPVSLGNTRLRTETAGVVAITLLANRS